MNINRLNWDDLKLFLAISATGSVRGAARETGLSINTVRARLEVMEHLTAAALVERSTKGLVLTAAGHQVREAAERMREAAEAAIGARAESRGRLEPERLNLSVTEGLASHWLMPRLAGFRRSHPSVALHLRTDAKASDQSLAGSDVALQLRQFGDPAFEVSEIGTLHLMPFASPAYLEENGAPISFNEWRQHRLVWQDWEPHASDIMPLFIADEAPARIISMITGSTSAQLAAIRAGIGLGFLPTFMARVAEGVRPIDFGMQFRRTIYLAVRRDVQGAAIGDLAELLRDAFADQSLFGEKFIVPQVAQPPAAPRVRRLAAPAPDSLRPLSTASRRIH